MSTAGANGKRWVKNDGAISPRIMSLEIHSDESAFVEWASRCHIPLATVEPGSDWTDLAAFGQMVGDARVVALSEGVHLAREPLEFRNRVFQYLVAEKGFTAIAIESGFVEGRAVYDYVRAAMRNLVRYCLKESAGASTNCRRTRRSSAGLKEGNAARGRSRKINFYGFDVSGSPGNPAAKRGPATGLIEALKYLMTVDRGAAAAVHARLDRVIGRIQFDFHRAREAPSYDRLTRSERDGLTAAIADLNGLFERREARYAETSGSAEYEWAYRAAISARQMDNWLRQIPEGWQPSGESVDLFPGEYPEFFAAATEVRDRAQADNLEWILRQEGDLGKVLIFGHSYHLSGAPVQTRWAGERRQEVLGTYLRRRLGDDLITIGNLIGGGDIGGLDDDQMRARPAPESLEGLAGEVSEPHFLLDLHKAPAQVAAWLDREREIGRGMDALRLSVGRAFDALLYLDRVTPAQGGQP